VNEVAEHAAAPNLLDVEAVAKRLSVSVRHVRRLIAGGALRATRLGGRAVRVAEDDLSVFVESRRSSAQ
jgi:excisionase family DNA binding protein